ncbi:MAG: hypothetical protein ABW136_03535 [Steroidobacteraceae bacterium]
MNFEPLLDAIQDSALAHSVSKSHHLVGALLQVVHIVGFVALLAATTLLALRAARVVLPFYDLRRMYSEIGRILWIGLALTIGSGVMMFVSAPRLYVNNAVFPWKMVMLIVAIVAQLVLFRVVVLRFPGRMPAAFAAGLSALLWFAVGVAGRGIGFA